MFSLVRRYVKTAIIFFLAGLMLGVWIMALEYSGGGPGMGLLISAHTHLLLYGFVITLIMGVAYWMFPRPAKDDFRYSPNMAEVNYWFITLGTVARTAGELGEYMAPGAGAVILMYIGAAAQVIGGFIFSWNIWSRIRAVGSQHREAKGEKF